MLTTSVLPASDADIIAAVLTPSAAPTVAVVIPCQNEAAFIEIVLDAIRTQDVEPHEIVLVDGGCVDGTMQIVEAYRARYPHLPLSVVPARGVGIPAALNTGIAACHADVVVRMDAHSKPASDYVRRCLSALAETRAAAVGGVWQIVPGRPGRSAAAIALAAAHPLGAGNASYRLRSTWSRGRRAVDTVPFGCFYRSHWREMGGYNEHLLANEDYEFNYRTRCGGGVVMLDPAIRSEYFARPTLSGLARQYFRYGWWKGHMLRDNPRSLQMRQFIPALFLPSWLLLGAASLAAPSLRTAVAGLLLLYLGVMLLAGMRLSKGDLRLAASVAAAFGTIHFAWSAGITAFLLTGAGAFIPRPRPDRVSRALAPTD